MQVQNIYWLYVDRCGYLNHPAIRITLGEFVFLNLFMSQDPESKSLIKEVSSDPAPKLAPYGTIVGVI